MPRRWIERDKVDHSNGEVDRDVGRKRSASSDPQDVGNFNVLTAGDSECIRLTEASSAYYERRRLSRPDRNVY